MSNSAVFKPNRKGVASALPATPSESPSVEGEHGGPRGSAVVSGCVMPKKVRRTESGERAKLSGCNEVANFFRFVRCSLGKTQAEMAQMVRDVAPKCDATTWGRWERGDHEPGAKVLLFVQRLVDGGELQRRVG